MERRDEERQEVSLSLEIIDPPRLGKVRPHTRDLSKKGAYILLDRDKCLPIGRDETSTVSARVGRVTDQGMGVLFLDYDFM
ncbi:MAG: hypothetical protein NUV51_07110 [Sulfuricaulis sp.]|nr:hypothetical protein [Sulfuricaulis sp.]